MTFKAVIFDFNGTLFWDTPFHNEAWDLFLERYQLPLTDQEKDEKIHGKPNKTIFNALFNREVSAEELTGFIYEKEKLYQEICLREQQGLADGVPELLNLLKQQQIDYTIATSAEINNLRFFFKQFKLDKWFDPERVVFDDGVLPGKPQPDSFQKAMNVLNCAPEECIIFEDSIAGIQAAEAAGAGKIIIVNSTGTDYSQYNHQVIKSFLDLDKSFFRSN